MLDTIIIGAGPAGLTAGIYAGRAALSHVILENGLMAGGQIINTSTVENYPGMNGISGYDLAMKFREHCDECQVSFLDKKAEQIKKIEDGFSVTIRGGEELSARTILLATGAKHRKLMIPGEEEFTGSGVSYCATCDGAFFRGKEVAVIGGGDVAVEDALFLSRICKKVTLLHRRAEFRAAKALLKKLQACDNVEFVVNAVPQKISGDGAVSELVALVEGEVHFFPVSGVFIAVGMVPNTELVQGLVACDAAGYVVAGEDCKTSVPGIFAAGDLRTKELRQVVTAAADGAVAVQGIERFLNESGGNICIREKH